MHDGHLLFLVAVLFLVFIFEALAILALSRQLRHAWKREDRWQEAVDDLNKAVELNRKTAETWERIAKALDPSISALEELADA